MSPFEWTEGFVAFDAIAGEPCVMRVKDTEAPQNTLERAAMIAQTEEACWDGLRKVFGVHHDTWLKTRFVVRSMPRDVTSCLEELRERLNLDGFTDGVERFRCVPIQ